MDKTIDIAVLAAQRRNQSVDSGHAGIYTSEDVHVQAKHDFEPKSATFKDGCFYPVHRITSDRIIVGCGERSVAFTPKQTKRHFRCFAGPLVSVFERKPVFASIARFLLQYWKDRNVELPATAESVLVTAFANIHTFGMLVQPTAPVKSHWNQAIYTKESNLHESLRLALQAAGIDTTGLNLQGVYLSYLYTSDTEFTWQEVAARSGTVTA